jgi:hypothetical protein
MGKITVNSYRRIVPPYGHYARGYTGKEVVLLKKPKLILLKRGKRVNIYGAGCFLIYRNRSMPNILRIFLSTHIYGYRHVIGINIGIHTKTNQQVPIEKLIIKTSPPKVPVSA